MSFKGESGYIRMKMNKSLILEAAFPIAGAYNLNASMETVFNLAVSIFKGSSTLLIILYSILIACLTN